MSGRIEKRFAALAEEARAGLVTFITAGDPNITLSQAILEGLPGAGADIIELGMPFTDPMADGPSIQASSLRALAGGQTLARTLAMVQTFRQNDAVTPIILMGYYNPIHRYGVAAFLQDAVRAGVDGLIIVDLPPEEDNELCLPAVAAGLRFIRLATPTTDEARLPAVLRHTGGFVYYVSMTGITGAAAIDSAAVEQAVARLKRHTELPIAVGFGIKTAAAAANIAKVAEAAVVGSAIVDRVRDHISADGTPQPGLTEAVLSFVSDLAAGVRGARVREGAAS